MRSRYTAFVLGDAAHLVRSWHPRTRPDDIDIDPDLVWMGLEIVDAEAGGADDATGAVEFRASWRQGAGAESSAGELHERSRFVRLRGRWHYLDGDVG
jgi:SEC-C motif-containing protein